MPQSRNSHKQSLNSTIIYFITGTKFSGSHNAMGMQDYGMYVWPDGSKYVGLFRDNKFHGEGYIELTAPHSVYFKVRHELGKLIKIENMSFADYLQVNFKWHGETISFENWDYCSSKDRQFAGEKWEPMVAVGPQKYKTREGPEPPALARNIFDLGFGKFNRLGCVTDIPSHLSDTPELYVGCPKQRAWIRNNCRHGELDDELDPEVMAQFTREIIENNLENDRDVVGEPHRELASSPRHKMRFCPDSSDSSMPERQVLCGDSCSDSSSSVFERGSIKTMRPKCKNCLWSNSDARSRIK